MKAQFLLLALAIGCAIAQRSPPKFPQAFSSDVTLVNNGETLSAQWMWSVDDQAERFDFAEHGAKIVEISDFLGGQHYLIWVPEHGSAQCETHMIPKEMPVPDFTNFTFAGQRIWHRQTVMEWQYDTHSTRLSYMVEANSSTPVQVSRVTQGGYEGTFFNQFQGGAQPSTLFNVSILFSGQCNKSAEPMTAAELIKSLAPKEAKTKRSESRGNGPAVKAFADANWNCADYACSSRVGAGAAQPNYQCAEFVTRSLAHGGFLPGVGEGFSQATLQSWKPGNGKVYDLLWVSSRQGGPLGLQDFLLYLGWGGTGGVSQATAAFVVGADGAFSHVAVGVDSNTLDAHNMARYHEPVSFYQVNQLLAP